MEKNAIQASKNVAEEADPKKDKNGHGQIGKSGEEALNEQHDQDYHRSNGREGGRAVVKKYGSAPFLRHGQKRQKHDKSAARSGLLQPHWHPECKSEMA